MDEFLQGSTILSQLDAEDGAQQSGASCLPAEKGKEHVVTSLQAMTLQQLGPSANLGVALQSLRADSTNQVALESSVASRQAAVSLESELQAGVEMATVDNAMITADVADLYAEPAHMEQVSIAPTASTLSLREQVHTGVLCGVCSCLIMTPVWRSHRYSLTVVASTIQHASVTSLATCIKPGRQGAQRTATCTSKCRCMACSDVCAICVPAAKIRPGQAFYRCGFCSAEAHKYHWNGAAEKLCFYCRQDVTDFVSFVCWHSKDIGMFAK